MKSYQITGPNGLDCLEQITIEQPTPGPDEVLIDMQAWSLNFRDTIMPLGGYLRNDKIATNPPLVPLSDGVGIVAAVGERVTRFKQGDRVAGIFFQEWIDGDLKDADVDSALGGAIDGVLSEQVVLNQNGLVHIPNGLSLEEASTLPCAAVTAWQALTLASTKPGQSILMQGTGGVSIFALQFAKAFGMRTIITSSSDEKLERAKELGADETINYKTHPDWEEEVLRLTAGEGVDHVIEVGGLGTLEKSLAAARVSGRISLIGILTGFPDQNPSPLLSLFKRLTIQGIYVGSRTMFEEMNRAIEINNIKPVVDKVFDFDDAKSAYEYMQSGKHFGKVVIKR